MGESKKSLELRITNQAPEGVKRRIKAALQEDIDAVLLWKKRMGKGAKLAKRANKMMLVNDFLVMSKHLVKQLDHASPSQLSDLLLHYQNMPIVKQGSFNTQQPSIASYIESWNARVALGLATWVLTVHGIYSKAIKTVIEEVNSQNERLDNTRKTWNAKMKVLADKVNREAVQVA